jgi:hypothetical protein
MPFSESIKLEVKRKSAFRCCRCQNIGIDVHHIIPEKDGGPSDVSNAAPLCQNCHDQFGDNPQKRKEIIQMRDWWYETCSHKFSGQGSVDLEILRQIDVKLENIKEGQQEIGELKQILMGLSNRFIDSLTAGTATAVASGIVNAASATQLGKNTYANFRCQNCGTVIGLLVGTNKCPTCGTAIN